MTIHQSNLLKVKRSAGVLSLAFLLTALGLSAARAEVIEETLQVTGHDESVRTYSWSDPDVKPKMMVIGLHGAIQHGGNYAALAKRLAPEGILFYSIDDRGHGNWLKESEKRPKVDYNSSTIDLIELTDQLRIEHPHMPVYCIGESLGASVAVRAISIRPKLFDGMILASAGDKPEMAAQWQATFKSIGQGFLTLGRSIDLTPHVTEISDDKRSSDEMINDPLCRKEDSLSDLVHTVNFLHKSHRLAKKLDRETPILVMQGSVDHIIQPGSTRSLFNQLPTKDKSFTMFPNVGHLLVTTEYLKPQVVETVESWLFSHAKQLNPITANAGDIKKQ